MPTLSYRYLERRASPRKYGKGFHFNSLAKRSFNSFTPKALGLGDVSQEGQYVQTLAAVLDLEGFTSFCNQVDSHLVVPEFLTRYLEWVFRRIRSEFCESERRGRVLLWGSLPYFAKFLGDGLLLLWDTDFSMGQTGIWHIVRILEQLTTDYRDAFLPEVLEHVASPPSRLRCGVARGQVVSVGEDGDFVGSCINIAARLQKLAGLSFAVSRRGLDPSDAPSQLRDLVLRQVPLRGIGTHELVFVKAKELRALAPSDRQLFRHAKGEPA